MNLSELWEAYRDGRCGGAFATLLGVTTAVLALLAGIFVLKPLVRSLSRKDIEKVFQARMRRTGFATTIASLALGVYVAFHAIWPAELRDKKLIFELAELLLIVFSGYVFLEILLSFFGDFMPRVRGQTPLA